MIGIDDKKRELVRQIAQKYNLRLFVLFGSQVTGQTHKESDFDFGYIADRDLSLDEEGRLIGEIMPLAEIKDERMVNLVSLKKTSPLLFYSALNNSQLIYEEEEGALADLQAYAFKVYVETLPLFRLKAERLGVTLK